MTVLAGTPALTRLALRRDRIRLPAYVLGLAALWAGMLAAEGAQPYHALVEETEIFVSTPAVRIFGVASGVSVGATVLIRGYVVLAVLAALMSTQAVVRHTRQNEETAAPSWSVRRSSAGTPRWPPRSSSRSAPTSRWRRRWPSRAS